jgi:S1-C subfamily serine protease
VESVAPGGPADKAGIHAGDIAATVDGQPVQLGGDIITAVEDREIRTDDDLTAAIAGRKQGDKVSLTIRRGAKQMTVDVTLGDRPASADASAPTTP